MEALGVSDVVAKSNGTSNPYNLVRATIDALTRTQSPRQVAQRRGIKVAEVLQTGEQNEEAMADA
jgi:small subunit ribosomal protein S5